MILKSVTNQLMTSKLYQMIKLRQYQSEIIQKVRNRIAAGDKRIFVQLTTGGGKTVIFTSIAQNTVKKGNSVLVITDRKELLTQAGSTFAKFGLTPEFLTAKTKTVPQSKLVVGMSETIKRRIKKTDYLVFLNAFTLIIVDEAHKQSFNRIFENLNENQIILGFSATPYRTGRARALTEDYDFLVEGIETSELIKLGYLANARTFSTDVDGINNVKITAGDFNSAEMGKLYDNPELFDGVIENYKKHADGSKALLFAATVKNSVAIYEQFTQNGISAEHVDASTPITEREKILADFKIGKINVLCNVGILTTGYDEPTIETIILYRATRSLPLFLQMCGRGSRVTHDKRDFKILDFGENVKRHGLWEHDREWELEIVNPPKKKGMAPVKTCPECESMINASIMKCPFCNYQFKKTLSERVEVILSELTPGGIQRYAENSTDIAEIIEIAKQKGYSKYWAAHKCKTADELIQFAKLISPDKWRGWYHFNKYRYGF